MTLDSLYIAKALDPVADALAGTVRSDVFDMSNLQKLVVLIHKGVGATGRSTITVQAADDTSPSNETAVPFRYKAVTTTDTQGAITEATASGFTLEAGSSQIYAIEIDSAKLAETGYRYVCLKAIESVNDPVIASMAAIGFPRYLPLSGSQID